MKVFGMFVTILLALNSGALCAVTVLDASGTTTITITGYGFGTKSTPAPLKWDTFEWGSDGDKLTDDIVAPAWVSRDGTDASAGEIDTSRPYAGSRAAYQDMTANNGDDCFYGSYITVTDTTTLYASTYIYYKGSVSDTFSGSAFLKLNRFNSEANYSGTPMLLIYKSIDGERLYAANVTESGPQNLADYDETGGDDLDPSAWHRVEMFLSMSDPTNTNSGDMWIAIDNEWRDVSWTQTVDSECPDCTTRTTSKLLDIFLLQFGAAGNSAFGTNHPQMWQDDVYVDNTLARVEICDSAQWVNKTHCELQIPISWASDEIEVTRNLGTFSGTDGTYLYVVGADGVPNPTGISINPFGNSHGSGGTAPASGGTANVTIQ